MEIDLNKIGHREDVLPDYIKAINDCDTLDKLKKTLTFWRPLAKDAYELVHTKMNEKKFKAVRKAIQQERKGIFSDNTDAMIIILPHPMFTVSQIAYKFKVPFGAALHRAIDLGLFK